jgi:hypothetical protein
MSDCSMCNVSDIFCGLWGAVQDVHGRTFGVWILLTCLLSVMTALNLDNEALYLNRGSPYLRTDIMGDIE